MLFCLSVCLKKTQLYTTVRYSYPLSGVLIRQLASIFAIVIPGSGDSSSDEDEDNSEKEDTSAPIIDQTETNLIALRRIIYLTIQVRFYIVGWHQVASGML